MKNVSQIIGCTNLEKIRYPQTMKEMFFNAILDCPNLRNIEVSHDAKIHRDAIDRCGNYEIVRY